MEKRFFDRRTGEMIATLPGDGTLRLHWLARAFDGIRMREMARHFGTQDFGGIEVISIPLDVPLSVPGGVARAVRRVTVARQSLGTHVTVAVERLSPSYQKQIGYVPVPQRVRAIFQNPVTRLD